MGSPGEAGGKLHSTCAGSSDGFLVLGCLLRQAHCSPCPSFVSELHPGKDGAARHPAQRVEPSGDCVWLTARGFSLPICCHCFSSLHSAWFQKVNSCTGALSDCVTQNDTCHQAAGCSAEDWTSRVCA